MKIFLQMPDFTAQFAQMLEKTVQWQGLVCEPFHPPVMAGVD